MEFWIKGRKKVFNKLRSNSLKNILKNLKKYLDFLFCLSYSKFLNLLKGLLINVLMNMELIRIAEKVKRVIISQQIFQKKYKSKMLYMGGYLLSSIGAYIHAGGKHGIKSKAYCAVLGGVFYRL
ncbi:MAG TPA: hypothetical protein VK469_10305 [Candidatus Kapabacteria bacterium]|nr:hypothetical protein [Candidatus Kapabacteria bacterium]